MIILLSEEEEINRLIDEAADEYVPFEEILKQNNITFEEALSAAEGEKEHFFDTLKKYGIYSRDISSVCYNVSEWLKTEQNDDILFLYIALLSEHMLLFDDIKDDEQKVTLWLDHHKHFEYIKDRIQAERILKKRFDELIKHKPDFSSTVYSTEEQSLLNEISYEQGVISTKINDIYIENLGELIRKTNSDTLYSRIKPYIYSTIILKKRKNMLEHKNYSPNISSVFNRCDYSISHDNRKNYKKYMAYIELYCHMKDVFTDESDIALSDYCFANLSNISEWFYENYEPSDEIPMALKYIIRAYADYLNFWHIELNENNNTSVTGILTSVSDFIV